jgi:hypothetical protein
VAELVIEDLTSYLANSYLSQPSDHYHLNGLLEKAIKYNIDNKLTLIFAVLDL